MDYTNRAIVGVLVVLAAVATVAYGPLRDAATGGAVTSSQGAVVSFEVYYAALVLILAGGVGYAVYKRAKTQPSRDQAHFH